MASVIALLAAQATARETPAPSSAEARDAAFVEPLDLTQQAQALIGQIETAFAPVCAADATIDDFTQIIAELSPVYDLDAVILAMAQLSANEGLCANARQAAREAQSLAQFAQAAAGESDATGAILADAREAPFSFGALDAPGGAGYR